MHKFNFLLVALVLLLVPLYPKFPLFGVSDTFVAVRLEDLVVAAVLLVYGFYLLSNRFHPLDQPLPRSVLLFWFVGALSVFSGIFLTKTAALNLGLLHWLRRVEYMSLFLVSSAFLPDFVRLKFLVRVILIVATIVAVYGLGQITLGLPVISTNNSEFSKGLALKLGPGARINSTFAGHYDLAAFSTLPLLLIIALLPISRHRLALVGIWGLVYWVLLMSASRVTFVSFFASATLLLVVIRRRRWLLPLSALAVVGVLISPQLRGRYLEFIQNNLHISLAAVAHAQTTASPAASKAVDTVPDALQSSPLSEDRSLNIRLNVEWPRALRSLAKNPILGTGYSSVGLAVDNEYLRILAETGALGLLAFALIIIHFFKTSLPFLLHYQPGFSAAFIAAVSCYLFSLLLVGVFIDVFAASKIALITWTLLGLAEKTKALTV